MGGAVHGRRWRAPKTPTLLDVLWVRGRLKLSKGYLSRVPHFNSICNYLENPELTPILYSLITETSLPLKSVEVDFAALVRLHHVALVRWFDHKYTKLLPDLVDTTAKNFTISEISADKGYGSVKNYKGIQRH